MKRAKPGPVAAGFFQRKIRRNNFFDRLEFVVSSVSPVNVKEEINALLVNG